ncbi:MAG: hypothetical protein MK183_05190 [Verrucomicrobiales bacterium]|nr:hypothetical protein [Verrucomicrobiales bacterium]
MKRYSLNVLVGVLLAGIISGISCGYLFWSDKGPNVGNASSGGGQGVTALPGKGGISAGESATGKGKTSEESVATPVRQELAMRAIELMKAGSVEEALKEILSAPGQMERMEALLTLVKGLDDKGVEIALAEVRGMGRGMDQFMSTNLLMARYAEIDPEKALKFASGSSGFERMMGTTSILRTWASKDPVAAGEYLVKSVLDSGVDDWQMRRSAASVASEWVRQDSDGALKWAKSLPEEVRGDALNNVVQHFTTDNPLKAADIAMSLEGESQERALRSIADQWSRTHPEAALQWAATLEGDTKSEAMEEALENWASQDPDAAVAFVGDLSSSEQERFVPEVAERWARRDADSAQAAAQWVSDFPESEGRERATGEVVEAWMRSDPTAASTWLGEQPAGGSKDRGIAAMLNDRQLREDPETAVAWAEQISDNGERSEQIQRSARRWLSSDRGAAVDYIESSQALNADQKAELINLTPEQLAPREERRFRGRPF